MAEQKTQRLSEESKNHDDVKKELFPINVEEKSQPSVETQKETSEQKKPSETSTRTSSSVNRKRLEYEVAQEKAKIDLKMARIQKQLLEKKLEADLAELDSKSRASHKSSVSFVSKVEDWLNKTQGNDPEDVRRSREAGSERSAPSRSSPRAPSHLAPQLHLAPPAHLAPPSHLAPPPLPAPHLALQSHLAPLPNLAPPPLRSCCDRPHNDQLLTRIATSKDLPQFYGDPMEWLQFMAAYYESTQLCNYSENENIWRLRKCLRGEAKDAVSSLLIGGSSPDTIIETLQLRFGRPELIMNKIVTQLKKLQPLPTAYYNEIINFAIKIKNYVAAAKAINQADYLRSPELVSLVVSKFPPGLVTKWSDYTCEQPNTVPKLEQLSLFLYSEANKAADSGVTHIKGPEERKPHKNYQSVLVSTNQTEDGEKNCKFCKKKTHELQNCTKFKRALIKDRWRFLRANKLCFKCFGRHPEITSCQADDCDVDGCGQPHHRLLHWKKIIRVEQNSESETVAHTSVQCQNESLNSRKVLLKVVPLTVHGPGGSVHAHALLDDGATVSLVAAELADAAGLRGHPRTMRARAAWDAGELVCQTEVINFTISNSDGERFDLCARKMKELNLPYQSCKTIDLSRYKYLENCICQCDIQPKLLIGQDNYHLIVPKIIKKEGKERGPYVTKTSLGWCVHGFINTIGNVITYDRPITRTGLTCTECTEHSELGSRPEGTHDDVTSHLFTIACTEHDQPQPHPNSLPTAGTLGSSCDYCDMELNEMVRRSFTLDSIGVTDKPRQNPDDLRAVSILDRTSQLADGQWTVGLPWRFNDFSMPDSYPTAFNRLRSIEKKMLANVEYASRYSERVQHLFLNNYAREVGSEDSSEHLWYLPHFGVDNPNKQKLRLVFDAAAKTNGQSLNDYLLQGPDLLQPLLGIMFRFREQPVGIIGDIKDMFLRINIKKDDQQSLRFLWKNGDSVKKYCMTSLIFGANCSPFIAQYVNQTLNTERFRETMTDAVYAIRTNQYMDDYIDSLETESAASQRIKDIVFINQQGGFDMRNWMSNRPGVLNGMPKETLSDKAVKFAIENQPERTLGLLWYPSSDSLAFDLSFKRVPIDIVELKRRPTKREMLRIIMSIFDVQGFLGPFTVKAKILMQESWKLNIKWDEKISEELFISFSEWMTQLKDIANLSIPRCYFPCSTAGVGAVCANETTIELHVFCDASPRAYAAVGYWRTVDANGRVCVSFITSKSRIAPIKLVTVPRLELQGALLASRLAHTIKKEHRIIPVATYYWTDSTIVLHWIRNQYKKYKVFIANRLGEIDYLTKIHEWHYVPTDANVADLATKENNCDLTADSVWFTGPQFLTLNPMDWPQEPENKTNINDDVLEVHNVTTTDLPYDELPIPDPTRFSSWKRLLRSTATVLLFIAKCRKSIITCINNELLKKAELLLLRHSQRLSFSSELALLKQNKPVARDSRLRELTPVVGDDDGLLRVGGRIGAVRDIPTQVKTPVILDGRDHTARLIVNEYHIRAAHGSNELVVNELRQKYWLLKLRPSVRAVSSKCLLCRIRKAVPKPPRLGDLPECRLTHHQRPFTMCGLDLFGPMEVSVARQRPKRYGVLFTCLTVRAVHIEIVSSLTTDSLIMALRRMAARRGWPRLIFSDNGTNMRGAANELQKALSELDQQQITTEALSNGTEWRFIPPASPHMGGAWERLVRSVKTALRVVLNERAPKEEVLYTLLLEVENIVNSRPLTHVSVDPQTHEALTPNHFLIGTSSNLPVLGHFDDADLCLRKQWRVAQRLTDLFWARWMKEVLPTLLPRKKWTGEGTQLRVGDLVVVVDPSSPRNTWPKGLIEKVYPGTDGRIRVVDIRTKTGVMKRPCARVASLSQVVEYRDDTGGENVEDGHAAVPEK